MLQSASLDFFLSSHLYSCSSLAGFRTLYIFMLALRRPLVMRVHEVGVGQNQVEITNINMHSYQSTTLRRVRVKLMSVVPIAKTLRRRTYPLR